MKPASSPSSVITRTGSSSSRRGSGASVTGSVVEGRSESASIVRAVASAAAYVVISGEEKNLVTVPYSPCVASAPTV